MFKQQLKMIGRTAGPEQPPRPERRPARVQQWFRDLKIGVKLGLGFVTVALIAAAVGLVGTINMSAISQQVQSVYDDHVMPLEPVHRIATVFQQLQTHTAYYLMDRGNSSSYEALIAADKSSLEAAMSECEEIFNADRASSVNRNQFNNLKDSLDRFWQMEEQTLQMAKAQHTQQAVAFFTSSFKNQSKAIIDSIGSLYQINSSVARVSIGESKDAAQHSIWFMMLLAGFGTVLAVGLGLLIARMISKPMRQLTEAAQQLADGDVEVTVRAAADDEIGLLTKAFDRMIASIRGQAEAVERLAAGDLDVEVRVRSEKDVLSKSIKVVIDTLGEMIAETRKLTAAAGGGQLTVRGDAAKFSGEYREVVEGVNAVLDAVVGPVYVASERVAQIAKGEIPPLITEEYQGDFNTLKESLNGCIMGLGALTECNGVLQRMADNDYTQKVEGEYPGVFGAIGGALNLVHAQLLDLQQIFGNMARGDFSDLAALQQAGRRSENDQLIPAFIQLMENVLALVNESVQLAGAATGGHLNARGDVDQFTGEYRRVIEGFNATLDAVTAPLAEAETVLNKLIVNDYTQEISGVYQGRLKDFTDRINELRERLLNIQGIFIGLAQGDTSQLEELRQLGRLSEHDRMLPAVVTMMATMQDLIAETDHISEAAAAGRLEVRGDAARFAGKYRAIVAGLNNALDAMVRPISEASAVLGEMAGGNLDTRMSGDYRGDYARIKDSLNGTIGSFNQILGEINRAVAQVASASRQVADGSQALSQGATEQAATIEELSASIAEIAAQTKQNAVRAGQATELAAQTQANASRGNERMQAMVAAMKSINEAATNIAKIIKVIDEIAFQTNILALNAAVEAARAGQHGKGFAVVAEEVRSLAGRSAKAAKETAELIEGSLRQVGDGTKIAGQTAVALSQIVTDVTKAADLVKEIATASNEQATGIAQINQGINQVSLVTQNTTATSQQSASTSEELTGQADHLREMVGRFRLNEA